MAAVWIGAASTAPSPPPEAPELAAASAPSSAAEPPAPPVSVHIERSDPVGTDFIRRVYFAAGPDRGPLQPPATPHRGPGPFQVGAGAPLWLVVEVDRAPEKRQLCARWADPAGNALPDECRLLPQGPARLAFAAPDTRQWPAGRYAVQLLTQVTEVRVASTGFGGFPAPRPVATVGYALGRRALAVRSEPPPGAGQGAPRPEPIGSGDDLRRAASRDAIPELPWPPPRPTTRLLLDPALCRGDAATLGAVGARFDAALQATGYSERSYYGAPGGFALATRLEQIEADGTPKPEPGRWAASPPRQRVFSIGDYLRALFRAPVGHYRVIVFVINDVPFAASAPPVDRDTAQAWLDGGLNRLPDAIARQPFGPGHACTALIYQFRTRGHGDAAVANPDGAATADRQLARSGILRALER